MNVFSYFFETVILVGRSFIILIREFVGIFRKINFFFFLHFIVFLLTRRNPQVEYNIYETRKHDDFTKILNENMYTYFCTKPESFIF